MTIETAAVRIEGPERANRRQRRLMAVLSVLTLAVAAGAYPQGARAGRALELVGLVLRDRQAPSPGVLTGRGTGLHRGPIAGPALLEE